MAWKSWFSVKNASIAAVTPAAQAPQSLVIGSGARNAYVTG
jgi:hypothetical protein